MLSIRTKKRPRSNRQNHDSPLTEPNKKTEINLGEYIVLKNTSGRNLPMGDVQVGQCGNWWQFSATDTLVPNAYALVCYGTTADQAQFLSANNLPTALTTDPTVQWHWQSTIDFPDAEGQATVRLLENGKPGATLDQVYWNPDGLQAINAHCDATCQADPNREAVVSLQLDDFTYDPANPWDEAKWTTAEATGKGKGTSQLARKSPVIRGPRQGLFMRIKSISYLKTRISRWKITKILVLGIGQNFITVMIQLKLLI